METNTTYIFIEDSDPIGDIAFVFGTWNAWKASVEKAAELYKKGLVPKIIDRELGLKNVRTIVAVVKNYHSRRALMTLRKHVPEHIQLKSAPYVSENYPFTKDTWMDSEIGKKNVFSEVEKIKVYLAKGDLKDL